MSRRETRKRRTQVQICHKLIGRMSEHEHSENRRIGKKRIQRILGKSFRSYAKADFCHERYFHNIRVVA